MYDKMTNEEFAVHRENAERVVKKITKRLVETKSKSFVVDTKGHSDLYPSDIRISVWTLCDFTPEDLLRIEAGEAASEPQDYHISVGCYYCGDHYPALFNGINVYAENECRFPGGIKSHQFTLNCSSGKMVFANDLRSWFQQHTDYNINSQLGAVQTTEAYAKIGMAHGFVGNTSPLIYQVNDSTLSISTHNMEAGEEYYDTKVGDWVELSEEQAAELNSPGKEIGSICTDLWWYSVVDFDDFKRRFLETGTMIKFDKYLKNHCKIAKVKPGLYQFTHHADARQIREVGMNCAHCAEIVWIGESEDLDRYEEYKKINYTAGQCLLANNVIRNRYSGNKDLPLTVFQLAERYKSLPEHELEKMTAWFYADLFCSFDRGSWHPNGWSGNSCEMPNGLETIDFPLPPLTQKYQWRDLSKDYCGLFLASTGENSYLGYNISTLNESFLAAAYEMCYSILKFGADGHKTAEEDPKGEARKKEIALESLKNLVKRFPNTLPEKCKEFL